MARHRNQAGRDLAIGNGLLWKHESGTYVKLTQPGADPFALACYAYGAASLDVVPETTWL
jgi:hypothetical protein